VILDTSALLAVLLDEADGEIFARAIQGATICRLSAATFVELFMVLESHAGDTGVREGDTFLRELGVRIEPFSEEQAFIARQAYSKFGKGRHPARLNLGDCFSYALAKTTGESLLFKGNDFRQTDVRAAI
jgi:ribonuclease VapC